MSERVKPFYECVHCGKKLTTEDRLAKHNCEMKKRHDFLKTTKGKAAYYCYLKWFELQGRTIKDISVFQSSRFYNNIIDFVVIDEVHNAKQRDEAGESEPIT